MPGADPHVVTDGKTAWMYPTRTDPERGAFYAYSSRDLKNWRRHGPVFRLHDAPWAEESEMIKGAWAPALAERGGKWYFYYSIDPTPSCIGMAVDDSAAGPFRDSVAHCLRTGAGRASRRLTRWYSPTHNRGNIIYTPAAARARSRANASKSGVF
ncbi:MAG: family 43 glycosylhydrolase [Opitutaceae bacterium]|jgi:beta-xylosidase|nr:family 43 glycosylhydrolase [Opitutaceae bacterium]